MLFNHDKINIWPSMENPFGGRTESDLLNTLMPWLWMIDFFTGGKENYHGKKK